MYALNKPETTTIRVLIADMPRVLADMVTAFIDQQPDMEVVGTVEGSVQILIAARRQTDILIIGGQAEAGPPRICGHLLNQYPHIRILVLGTADNTARAYWLGLRQRQTTIRSARSLLESIRDLHNQDVMDD